MRLSTEDQILHITEAYIRLPEVQAKLEAAAQKPVENRRQRARTDRWVCILGSRWRCVLRGCNPRFRSKADVLKHLQEKHPVDLENEPNLIEQYRLNFTA